MADKKISELDLALQIDNDAEFPMSQDNAGEPTTFKGRITLLATKIAEDMTFSNLQTTSKKLVGAINELLSLGNPIIIGTTAPTSSQGANGNLYIQYTEGTGGADDEVDGIFVKIDGAWCEISTGGGSGTTDYEDLSNKPQVNSVELVGNKSLDDLGIMPASLSKTVSGAIAHFTDGADNIPVKSLVSEIVAVESGSGEKSPDNPYTISGFDNGIITVTDNDQITNTYTFAFGQTVYGGHFDNKGNLVVTHGFVEITGTENLYLDTAPNVVALSGIPIPISQVDTSLLEPMSNIATYSTQGTGNFNNNEYGLRTTGIVYYKNTSCTTLNDFKTFFGNNHLQICYKLATPITLSITSQDIPTLSGENNIFSNCGDVEVNYYTDNADEIVEVAKTTASTPLHNYSTDEQVVGTWIDGSTLYGRVIVSTTTPTANTWNDISLGEINVVDFKAYLNRTSGSVDVFDGTGTDLVGNIRPLTSGVAFEYKVSSGYLSNFSNIIIKIQYTKSST